MAGALVNLSLVEGRRERKRRDRKERWIERRGIGRRTEKVENKIRSDGAPTSIESASKVEFGLQRRNQQRPCKHVLGRRKSRCVEQAACKF